MKIVHITNIGGKPIAIMDNNQGVTLELIEGNPRLGVSVEEYEPNKYRVTGNLTDESCVNGVCPIK